ncbi:hypothetical protein BDZ89DRAFT_1154873 [Hymenopellis radicata]|nr:hypothetical protein BDZ89DRAFT_1154873 [Hymenopellis radicata]
MSDFADFAVWLSNRPNMRFSSVPVTPTSWTFPGCQLMTLVPWCFALVFQDVCLPLVAKLVYECMELFKTFELQRRSTPLPAVRTWHRRIPGLKKQPAHAPLVDAVSDIASPEHAILICEGDPDLVALRGTALTLLASKLPHLNLVCPIDPGGALDSLRGLIFQDICLPPVAKLVYKIMELFKGFELERPLLVLRTWHRRILGCTPARSQLPDPQMESDSDSDSDYIP